MHLFLKTLTFDISNPLIETMIEKITTFLINRLESELPYSNIEEEDLDELLKKFIIKEQKNPTKSHRICATMIALFEENGEIYFPCILRPQKSRVHPGQIAFPGGGREGQDKDLSDTAIRETLEEVGAIVPKSQIIGSLTNMYVPPSNSMITPKIAFLKERPIYQIDPNEVDKVIEVSISDLLNQDNHTIKTIQVKEGITVQMPAIQVGEYLIWGATARILKEFTLILKEMN
jgi:8-oxo-dGTP pyrophosphatase MutT (NUDIX family)